MTHKMNYEDKKSIKIEKIKSMKVETWKPKKKKNLSIFGELLTSSVKTKAGRMVGK